MKDSCISATATIVDSVAVDSAVTVAQDTTSSAQADTVAVVEAAAATAKEESSIGQGLELMVIGMLTVFTILLIVINFGKLLIKIVNAIAPEEKAAPKKAAAAAAPAAIDANTMAILEQTVSQITGGKGHVASAKKI